MRKKVVTCLVYIGIFLVVAVFEPFGQYSPIVATALSLQFFKTVFDIHY